jgi:hypothetical protein
MSADDIEGLFPTLEGGKGYEKTSDESEDYNCFAWAAGYNDRRLDPTEAFNPHWPADITKSPEISSFEKLFRHFGFEPCDDATVEPGVVKIALYEDKKSGEAMHAARQLESGKWTSKIGDFDDISHDTLESLEGFYGTLVMFMRKKTR